MSDLTPIVAPALPLRVAGWHVTEEGYAQPAAAGGGYVEESGGVVAVAFETDQSARDMGLGQFLITKVPVEVLRELVRQHDQRAHAAAEAAYERRNSRRDLEHDPRSAY